METPEEQSIRDQVYAKMMRIEMKRALAFFDSSIALCAIILIEEGLIKAVNKRFLKELGYDYLEVIGEPWTKFVWPDDVDMSVQEDAQMKADSRGTIKFVNRWKKKNGEPIIFQWKTQIDTVNGLYFCIIDILEPCVTERTHICLCGINTPEGCWRAHKKEIGGLKLT